MARRENHWWGFYLILSHSEACRITNRSIVASAQAIADMIGAWIGGIGAAIAAIIGAAIWAAMSYIRDRDEHSGGRGVKLKFLWPAVYVGVERRGRGNSPCS